MVIFVCNVLWKLLISRKSIHLARTFWQDFGLFEFYIFNKVRFRKIFAVFCVRMISNSWVCLSIGSIIQSLEAKHEVLRMEILNPNFRVKFQAMLAVPGTDVYTRIVLDSHTIMTCKNPGFTEMKNGTSEPVIVYSANCENWEAIKLFTRL